MKNIELRELGRQLRYTEISARELAAEYLMRIEKFDAKVGAFLSVCPEQVMKQADEAQARIERADAEYFTGIPIAIKDNLSTQGIKTTAGSKVLENYVPPFDAFVVERLRSQTAVFLGKTNLDEFAMGTSGSNSAFKPTYNPINLNYWAGGSSSGSAAAVACGMVPVALGSDTGGSVRLPASFCGIVGFKPSYGRCSRYGLISYASSLDQVGVLARNVDDAAIVSSVITGYDSKDSTSIDYPPIEIHYLRERKLNGLKIALPKEFFGPHIQTEVRDVIQKAIDYLVTREVIFKECSLPSLEHAVSAYYIIAPAEASSNLSRFDGIRYGTRLEGNDQIDEVAFTRGQLFGHEVKQRIMMGTYVLSAGYYDAYYMKAQKLRLQMTKEFNSLFKECDAILTPTVPSLPFRVGDPVVDSMTLKMFDLCTIPANLGGFPAISIPAGESQGLPVGLQLIAPWCQDERLLQIAYSIEDIFRFHTKPHPLDNQLC